MNYLRTVNLILTALMATAVIGGFIPGVWVCDLLSQFRLVFEILLVINILLSLLIRDSASVAIAAGAFVINTFPIGVLLPQRPHLLSSTNHTVSILNFNTQFDHNQNFERFQKLVAEKDPDLITLVEVNQKWADAMPPLLRAYPFKLITTNNGGLAVFSKYPFTNVAVRYFGKAHHPRISALWQASGRDIHLLLIHPTTPQSEAGYRERNQEFQLISDELKAESGPRIVLGDFNCGPWAQAFKILTDSGLVDSERGFGAQQSWPARTGEIMRHVAIAPFVPIDHLLTSPDLRATQRVAGPAIGSDHLPIFVRLQLPDHS